MADATTVEIPKDATVEPLEGANAAIPAGATVEAIPYLPPGIEELKENVNTPQGGAEAPWYSRLVSGVGQEVAGAASGLYNAAVQPPQTPTEKALSWLSPGAVAAKRVVVDPTVAKAASTIDAIKQGQIAKAGLGAMATVDPLAPDVTKLYEQSESGDVAGAIGRGLVDVGMAATPVIAPKVLGVMGRIANPPVSTEGIHAALTDALKPGPRNAQWTGAVNHAIASDELTRAVKNAKVPDPATGELTAEKLPIKTPPDLYEAIHQRLGNFWQQQIEPRLAAAGYTPVDKAAIGRSMDQIKQGISAKMNPEKFEKALGPERAFYDNPEPMTIAEAQKRVQDLNTQLDSFFQSAKGQSADQIEATAARTAASLAELQGLNDQITKAVENITGGPPGELSALKKRWGNLKQVEEQTRAAKIAFENRTSTGLVDAIRPYMVGKIAVGVGGMLLGHPEFGMTAAALGGSELALNRTQAWLKSAPRNIQRAVRGLEQRNPPPEVPWQAVQRPALPPGPTITPPPPDTSFVRGTPAQPQPPTAVRMGRLLPAGVAGIERQLPPAQQIEVGRSPLAGAAREVPVITPDVNTGELRLNYHGASHGQTLLAPPVKQALQDLSTMLESAQAAKGMAPLTKEEWRDIADRVVKAHRVPSKQFMDLAEKSK